RSASVAESATNEPADEAPRRADSTFSCAVSARACPETSSSELGPQPTKTGNASTHTRFIVRAFIGSELLPRARGVSIDTRSLHERFGLRQGALGHRCGMKSDEPLFSFAFRLEHRRGHGVNSRSRRADSR